MFDGYHCNLSIRLYNIFENAENFETKKNWRVPLFFLRRAKKKKKDTITLTFQNK
mgnify:CR=1 FL=1